MPELRKDPVVGRWVIIATERARRPSDFVTEPVRPRTTACAFCEGREDQTPPEILAGRPREGKPNTPGWTYRLVATKCPASRTEGELAPPRHRDADHPDHGVRGARRRGPVLRLEGAVRLVRHGAAGAPGRRAHDPGSSGVRGGGAVRTSVPVRDVDPPLAPPGGLRGF